MIVLTTALFSHSHLVTQPNFAQQALPVMAKSVLIWVIAL